MPSGGRAAPSARWTGWPAAARRPAWVRRRRGRTLCPAVGWPLQCALRPAEAASQAPPACPGGLDRARGWSRTGPERSTHGQGRNLPQKRCYGKLVRGGDDFVARVGLLVEITGAGRASTGDAPAREALRPDAVGPKVLNLGTGQRLERRYIDFTSSSPSRLANRTEGVHP
jgi:hypothetical protein